MSLKSPKSPIFPRSPKSPKSPKAVKKYEVLDKSGYTSIIYYLPGTRKACCKSFLPHCIKNLFPAEKEAYERFTARGHPSSILNYYGVDKNEPAGLLLELAEKGSLYHYLWSCRDGTAPPPSQGLLYRWARQAAEALAFAHSCGVLNSDIHVINFLLDENLDMKVADWAGASIDGKISWSYYRTTYLLPGTTGKTISIKSEIFALGSALYYMVKGQEIFPGLSPTQFRGENREEIQRRFKEKKFPDTSKLPVLGSVISKCWNLEYMSMLDVLKGIEAEQGSTPISKSEVKVSLKDL